MTTMNISVPDEMKAFVEAQMARRGMLPPANIYGLSSAMPRNGRPSRSWKPSSWKGCKALSAR